MPDHAFAARLNSFRAGATDYWRGKSGKVTTFDLIARAATVDGLGAVDLNYPDHLEGTTDGAMAAHLRDCGLALNGYAMRYYTDPAFKIGAFTNPDPAVRRKAIDLTRRGIDSMRAAGGRVMTLWLGQDGFDYSFQADYRALWDMEVAAIREVAAHDPAVDVSIEYKPNEPRAFAVLPDVATTLLAVREAGAANLGVTLDFAHVLYAGEMPAYAAALVARHSRLLGVHLNDGYAHRDDGLMVGAVHVQQTIELLAALDGIGYDGVLYFDTFPDVSGLDPVAECAANIAAVRAMLGVAGRLKASPALAEAVARQDAVAGQRLVQAALFGA
ncbi:sugar phosphate isomerase/epimerase family protein [Labrys wisconsinensis]|uniref:Xylose isomerase n=1 Tax=Labrys wisconsinensis TaxID=425677 RepID=A0ABU0JH69_9HYPH|nr:TIM barrel protein [Labrys wisconsinensis]MDQ0472574.1 xylose isomerase [Labrys wisconsinensis]